MERVHPPIIVISGAIGSGKGTLLHALVHEMNLNWVPTHTTRVMRRDDPSLSRRIFDTEATFLRHLARGELIESVEKGGNRYGLLRADLDHELKANHPSVIELTVEGGRAVAKEYPNTLLIFLFTNEKLRYERIRHRTQNKDEVDLRMKEAYEEEKIARKEYDYLIENVEHHPEQAIETVKKIILERFPKLRD